METQISQQIEVITHFHNLKLEIIKFKWKNTIYKVSQLISKWRVISGESFEYHLLLSVETRELYANYHSI